MGRYSSYTPKRARILLDGVAAGLSVAVAAQAAGICRKTAYNWRHADPAFAAAWDEAIETYTDMLEARIQELTLAGDTTALIFLLKARKPVVYNPNLLLRQQMLQVALEKARADAAAGKALYGTVTN